MQSGVPLLRVVLPSHRTAALEWQKLTLSRIAMFAGRVIEITSKPLLASLASKKVSSLPCADGMIELALTPVYFLDPTKRIGYLFSKKLLALARYS